MTKLQKETSSVLKQLGYTNEQIAEYHKRSEYNEYNMEAVIANRIQSLIKYVLRKNVGGK